MSAPPKRGVDVALHDVDLLEDALRLLRIEQRRAFLIVDDDARGIEHIEVLVREQQHRLGHVPNVALDEERLILLDEIDDVPSGNVAMVDDGETRPVEVQLDVPHATTRNRRPNGAPVQHAGNVRSSA